MWVATSPSLYKVVSKLTVTAGKLMVTASKLMVTVGTHMVKVGNLNESVEYSHTLVRKLGRHLTNYVVGHQQVQSIIHFDLSTTFPLSIKTRYGAPLYGIL